MYFYNCPLELKKHYCHPGKYLNLMDKMNNKIRIISYIYLLSDYWKKMFDSNKIYTFEKKILWAKKGLLPSPGFHKLAKNHSKHVKLNKVLDNDGHPRTASVGNDTSILNTLKLVPCCPYSTRQHYYFGQLNNVSDQSTRKRCWVD